MAEKKKRYSAAAAIIENLPPPPVGEADDYWEKNLEYNDKNRIVVSLRNIVLVISRNEDWAGVIAFDQFSNQVVKRKPPPFAHSLPGPWDDGDDLETVLWISQHYGFNADKKLVMQAVLAVARRHQFHPVREWFATLVWDKKPRLETWLAQYLGASEGEYSRLVGKKFLVGAVARVMRPGCKMDNVLILEGEQGRWKSTALRTLAGEAWFSDTPFTIGEKDAYLVMRGVLIYELAELDGFSRTESSRGKAFFSSGSDTYVQKYVAWAIKVPRQLVFCGTVNHGTYLRDTTGNRRYWPVKIARADIEKLARDREQLWAEAVHLFAAGERWWVQENEREIFELEQNLRYVGDAYEDKIRAHVAQSTREEHTMQQILEEALHLETSKWTRAEQIRVGEVMAAIGWRRVDRGQKYSPRYVYKRAEREPGEEG
jgi:putative DNA primase/helicase